MGKKIGIGCIIVLVVVIVIAGLGAAAYIISSRNNMVAKEVAIQEAWAQVQNVYQRRLDLVPNLAESAKAYMQLEKDIFEAIAEARQGIQNAETPAELAASALELLQNDDVRQCIALEGRRTVEEGFTWKDAACRLRNTVTMTKDGIHAN